MPENKDIRPEPTTEPSSLTAGEAASTSETEAVATVAAVKPPKRRRWLRRLGIGFSLLLILLVVLAGATPWLLSTRAGADYALSFANARLKGALRMEGLSLSWFGANEVRGLRVLDAAQREVLKVDQVSLSSSLWSLLTSGGLSFGEITIDNPRAVLYVNAANEVSLANAFEMKNPSPSKSESGPLPEVRGRIIIRNGSVRALRENGTSYEIPDFDGQVDLQTLATVGGKLQIKLQDGAQIAGDVDLRQLLTEGKLRPAGAVGKVNLQSDKPIDLAPLAKFAAPDLGLSGTLNLDVRGAVEPGNLRANFDVSAAQLKTGAATPINISLKGQAEQKGEVIRGQTTLTAADAGAIDANLTYHTSGKAPALKADQVLAAILSGEKLELPEFEIDVKGGLDLAKLQKSLPGVLKVKEGQEITGGKLEITKLSAKGGAQPSANGALALKDLSAVNSGKPVRLEPITLGFDAALQTGKGLQLDRVELKSSFAQVDAKGAASDLKAVVRANLTKLQQELGQIFDLSGFELAGDFNGELQLARANNERVNVSLKTDANALKYATKSNRFELQRLNLSQTGFLTLANQKARRFDVTEAQADLDGQIVLAATGWYDFDKRGFKAAADVKKADLGFAASRAKALGMEELARYAGVVTGQATAECGGTGQAILSSGALLSKNLAADGKPLLEGDAQLKWANVKVEPALISADSARLESAAATVDAKSVKFKTGGTLDFSAEVNAKADLARVMRAVGAVAKMEKPPAVAGQLALDSKLTTANNEIVVAARGGIDQLEVGAGEKTVREKRLDLELDAKLDQAKERLALNKVRLASGLLSAELGGTVDQYKTSKTLALKGRYDADWQSITTLLHELAPATANTVVVQGKSASAFEITGPANQAGARPPFRGLKTGLDLAWTAAEVYGIEMGAAKLSPALSDGQLKLPNTVIPTKGDGKVHLGGMVDFQPADPTLKIPGKVSLLERIVITPLISKLLLSWINPIFYEVVAIEGRMDLQTENVNLPFGESLKKSGDAKGFLDLGTVKVKPSGFMGQLLELAGSAGADGKLSIPGLGGADANKSKPNADPKDWATVQFKRLDFLVKDGRLRYDNFALTFPDNFDVKFRGSVGFDGTLDLIASVPVRAGLLQKLGVKGPALEFVKQAGDLRVDLPIVGTREQPKFDFAKINTQELLKQIVVPKLEGKEIEKGLGDLLKGLEGDKKEEKPKKP